MTLSSSIHQQRNLPMNAEQNSTKQPSPAVTYGDLSGLSHSDARNNLYLVPAAETKDGTVHVLVSSVVGAGCPEPAYHGRWHCLGRVSATSVPASLLGLLQVHEQDLLTVAARYQGSHWDGNNHRGRWRDATANETDAEAAVEQALTEVASYWDADEWFAPLGPHFAEELAHLDSLDAQVEHEVSTAAATNEYLDDSNVRETLLGYAQARLEEHEETDDDEPAARLRTRLRGWLADA
jgi:hypothetical protein